jgi:hypothetical protein
MLFPFEHPYCTWKEERRKEQNGWGSPEEEKEVVKNLTANA